MTQILFHQDHGYKFIAAQSADLRPAGRIIPQQPRHRLNHIISTGVSVPVIDKLKVIHVKNHHCQPLALLQLLQGTFSVGVDGSLI